MTDHDTPKSDFAGRVSAWLQSQGYPLEMEVAAAFGQRYFHVTQAEYYTDPETLVQREIDVVAHLQRDIDGVLLRISFVLECKLSRDKPWILFTAPSQRLSDRARVAQRAASLNGMRLLMDVSKRRDIQRLGLLQLGERAAYGLTQAFTTGLDITFAALQGVCKATAAQLDDANRANVEQRWTAEIIFPVIVIDGGLFEYFLTPDSTPLLREVRAGVLAWRNPATRMPHTFVHIVTRTALKEFVERADEDSLYLLTQCDEEVGRIADALAIQGSQITPPRP